jgi:hypothetical protein
VRRGVGREAPLRLLELPLAADPSPAAGLIPRDSDVDEALVEVALAARRRAPRELELLVRREELPGPDQVEPVREPALLRVV